MAIHRTAKIPFSRVVRIGVWDNHINKQSMNTVYTKLCSMYPGKEVCIANGGFFTMNSQKLPCWGCKADGKMISNEWKTDSTAYFAMNGKNISFHKYAEAFPSNCTDGISVYPALIENGRKSTSYHTYPDGNSNRGRTMLGFNSQYVVLSCISDTAGSSDFTCKEELDYMLSQGCTYAGNLDGGGSSQCNFNGGKISSSRIVSNFVYIIANPASSTNTGTATGNSSKTVNKEIQKWLNSTYNAGLAVDGSLGPASKKAIIKAMQIECGVKADGSWGPASKAAYKPLYRGCTNNTPNKVRLVQCALARKGFWNQDLVGIFDDATRNMTMLYQRSAGLVVDGSVGVATITSLFK